MLFRHCHHVDLFFLSQFSALREKKTKKEALQLTSAILSPGTNLMMIIALHRFSDSPCLTFQESKMETEVLLGVSEEDVLNLSADGHRRASLLANQYGNMLTP